MTSKYKWNFERTHLDRSMPTGRRVTTDSGAVRPRITPALTRADLDRRDNPADRSQGLRPGEPEVQDREDAECQRFIDRAMSGEFDRRADERWAELARNAQRNEFADRRSDKPGTHPDDRVDRRYLGFPEAHGNDAETTQKRHVDIVFGKPSKNEEQALCADFFRGIIANQHRPTDRMAFDVNKRLVSAGTTTEGGYAVPPGYLNMLVMPADPLNSLYANSTIVPVKVNEGTHPIIDTVPVVTYGAETAAFDESDTTLDQGTYEIFRRSALTKLTMNAVEDSDPGLLGVVMTLLNQALAIERERACAYGNGTTEPTGIYQASGITDVSGITAVNFANLNRLLMSVDIRHQAEGSWVLNQTVLGAVSGLVDLNNRPIFVMDPTTAMRPYILGRPVFVNNSLPNTFIAFGALKYNRIWDRGILLFDTTREAGDSWAKNQIWARISERQGAKYVGPPGSVAFARSKVLTGVS